jgi:hypothetical protein
MKNKAVIGYAIVLIYILLSYSIFLFCSDEKIVDLTLEDHLYEWFGFWTVFLASVFFFIAFFVDKRGNDLFLFKTPRNIFYLFLGLLLFFLAGEEITWGQRVFNFQTSALMNEANAQNEQNIHNLAVFSGIFNMDHLFTLFWMVYCVLIPILDAKWVGFSRLIQKINLPVVPLWLSFFFALNYVIFLIVKFSVPFLTLHAASEVKETTIETLFCVVGLVMVLNIKKAKA